MNGEFIEKELYELRNVIDCIFLIDDYGKLEILWFFSEFDRNGEIGIL